MLVGMEHHGILNSMEKSSFEFHLTGSRLFGGATENSDWDFFAMNQPGLDNWLETNGFERKGIEYGPNDFAVPNDLRHDLTIAQVWESKDWWEPKVHVQVIHSQWFPLKQACQKIILDHDLMRNAFSYKKQDAISNEIYKTMTRVIWTSVRETLVYCEWWPTKVFGD